MLVRFQELDDKPLGRTVTTHRLFGIFMVLALYRDRGVTNSDRGIQLPVKPL